MRRTLGNGIRQINLLLIPSAALLAVLAVPIIRLVYQHGSFHTFSTHLVATALFWFAFSLPFAGVNLLLSRTFFALQRPWIPTKLAAINMVVDIVVSLALYKPLGIAGPVIGTVVANVVMTWLQLRRLRIGFNGRLEMAQTTMVTVRILVATAIMTALGYLVWKGLDALLGHVADRPDHRPGDRVHRRRPPLRPAGAGDADPRGAPDPVADRRPAARSSGTTARSGSSGGASASAGDRALSRF